MRRLNPNLPTLEQKIVAHQQLAAVNHAAAAKALADYDWWVSLGKPMSDAERWQYGEQRKEVMRYQRLAAERANEALESLVLLIHNPQLEAR